MYTQILSEGSLKPKAKIIHNFFLGEETRSVYLKTLSIIITACCQILQIVDIKKLI